MRKKISNSKNIWTGVEHVLGLPISFTKYTLTPDTITIRSGITTRIEREIKLYRIKDISSFQTLLQRYFKVGSIELTVSDKDNKCTVLRNIPRFEEVKDLIILCIEESRNRNSVKITESANLYIGE